MKWKLILSLLCIIALVAIFNVIIDIALYTCDKIAPWAGTVFIVVIGLLCLLLFIILERDSKEE